MKPRINYITAAPKVLKSLRAIGQYLQEESFDPKLQALVELRVSQINGCAFCLDAHNQDARARGESQQRLDCLSAWRETTFFTDREQAALAWAESLTRISETQAPDDVYEQALKHFSEKELVDLTLVIASINTWNRLSIGFRKTPAPRLS
jgi:AhpD family alkylhydroperoxidase